jgi:hypothetical protein
MNFVPVDLFREVVSIWFFSTSKTVGWGQIKVDIAISGADNSSQLIYVFFPRGLGPQGVRQKANKKLTDARTTQMWPADRFTATKQARGESAVDVCGNWRQGMATLGRPNFLVGQAHPH